MYYKKSNRQRPTRKQVEATLKYYTNLNRLAEVSGEVLPSPLSRSKKILLNRVGY